MLKRMAHPPVLMVACCAAAMALVSPLRAAGSAPAPSSPAPAGPATPAEPRKSTLEVPGLKAPVTVRRDVRGIPAIEAANAHDLFFAQGFVTAGDRLWQMDLLRRSARGQLAEIFGKDVLEQDIQIRNFDFGRLADGLVARVQPALREALTAYAEGVNANIAARGSAGLPSEFALLGYRPKPWLPSDSLVIGKLFALDLDLSWPGDLARAGLADLPKDMLEELFVEKSPLDVILVGAEKKVGERAGNVKSGERSGEKAGDESGDSMEALPSLPASVAQASFDVWGRSSAAWSGPAAGHRGAFFGLAASNNWVIAGKRSSTGKPLLANDPHLSPTAPSIWYMTHLTGAGFHVAGVTPPGVVGIVIGHNEKIAWGLTNLMADVQDLYVEEFDEKGRVTTPAGARAAEVRKEKVLARAASPDAAPEASEHDLTRTRHGPVVLAAGPARFALRWTALDADACEVCAFFDIDKAGDWKEFQAALVRHTGPPLNFVYADTSNHIGWSAAGRIPVRKGGNGTTPLDGRTDTDSWSGYIPWSEMPRLYDPPESLIITANNRVVGPGYPRSLTHAWVTPYRARRIQDLLAAIPRIGIDDCGRVQGDTVSLADLTFARELEKAAKARTAADAKNTAADASADWAAIASTLADWDGRAHEDSRVMPIVAAARTLFTTKVLTAAVGANKTYNWPSRDTLIDSIVSGRPAKWLPKEYASYDDLFLDCWKDGRAALAKKAGDDAANWTWGKVADPVVFAHPLGGADAGAPFLIDPIPASTGGSGETVNAGAAVSMRFIADCSDWDRSLQGIALGESGDPSSPHWKDQLETWRTVKTQVFPFSPKALAQATVEVQTLAPKRK